MNRRRFLMAASTTAAATTLGIHDTKAAAHSSRSGMKITDLKMVRSAPPRDGGWNWIFLKITTDSGLYGWGEASLQEKDAGVMAEIESFKKFLIGQDPFQIEHIWTSLHRRVTWTGGAVTMSAVSAIDLALWDIKGKALGVPVYELAGGKVRDKVKLYANGWFEGSSPEDLAQKAKETVAKGYKCLKLYPFGGPQVITPERMQLGVDRVAAIREAVGPNIEIGVDIRNALNIWGARRVAQKLEPLDIAFMEEPILYDNSTTLVKFAREARVPIAVGERLYTRWQFREVLEKNAVDIIQPDICHAGGLSELKKIAAMAETYYVTLAPHNSNGPISTIASLHLDMMINNCFMQELILRFFDRYNEVLTNPIVVEDGYGTPPAGPGWGTDLREDILARPCSKSLPEGRFSFFWFVVQA
ncbi:MAG: galactonate dehydratase, partial [Verrucomicrobia bacterium]|nr:galactonate dehydratase [Verrucomicrobiota bacterium]MDA1069024.1 galactonate dehydratase [Verrucomicrobiota bacterium]